MSVDEHVAESVARIPDTLTEAATATSEDYDPFEWVATVAELAHRVPTDDDFLVLRACWIAAAANGRSEVPIGDEDRDRFALFLDLLDHAGFLLYGREQVPA